MGYVNPAAEWIFVPFMFIAGASYPLMFIAVTKRPLALVRDGEFLFYSGVTLSAVALLTWVLQTEPAAAAAAAQASAFVPDTGIAPTLLDNIRTAAFQITSLISSAGFASVDYEMWSDRAKLILFAVMVLGGCAGSAAGGAKEVRFLIALKFLIREFTRVLHPRAVLPLRYRGEALAPDIVRAVFTLVFLYLVGYFVVAIPIMLFTDVDLVEGFGASVGCLSNVGPAFGRAGPMGNYDHYPDAIKVWLTFTMLLGRLEIVTMLALLHPHVWRNLEWRGTTNRPRL
jgi:trk system potassium uptake protein TrkH